MKTRHFGMHEFRLDLLVKTAEPILARAWELYQGPKESAVIVLAELDREDLRDSVERFWKYCKQPGEPPAIEFQGHRWGVYIRNAPKGDTQALEDVAEAVAKAARIRDSGTPVFPLLIFKSDFETW